MNANQLTAAHYGKRITLTATTSRGKTTHHDFILGHAYVEEGWVHLTAAGEDLWGGIAVTATQPVQVHAQHPPETFALDIEGTQP